MSHYIARFGDDPNIKGAIVSTFNGALKASVNSLISTDKLNALIQADVSLVPPPQDGELCPCNTIDTNINPHLGPMISMVENEQYRYATYINHSEDWFDLQSLDWMSRCFVGMRHANWSE